MQKGLNIHSFHSIHIPHYSKINSKQLIRLNIKPKTIEFQEHIECVLMILGQAKKGSFDKTVKSTIHKVKGPINQTSKFLLFEIHCQQNGKKTLKIVRKYLQIPCLIKELYLESIKNSQSSRIRNQLPPPRINKGNI